MILIDFAGLYGDVIIKSVDFNGFEAFIVGWICPKTNQPWKMTSPCYGVQLVVRNASWHKYQKEITCDIWDGQLTLNWGVLLTGYFPPLIKSTVLGTPQYRSWFTTHLMTWRSETFPEFFSFESWLHGFFPSHTGAQKLQTNRSHYLFRSWFTLLFCIEVLSLCHSA